MKLFNPTISPPFLWSTRTRRLIRGLISQYRLGPGTRLLDVGDQANSPAAALRQLGIEADTFATENTAPSTACDDLLSGDAIDLFVDIEAEYDAVLVRRHAAYY